MHTRTSFARLATGIAAAAVALVAHAQDGAYDPTFGVGGQTWIDVTSSTSDESNRLIRLPSGNFFMAGGCGPDSVACAAWLTPAGQLATGYGPSGTGKASFSDYIGWPAATDAYAILEAAAFADGRVAVVADKTGGDAYLAVLRANGTGLDASVGNGAGYISVPFAARLLRVTPEQKLIVVGFTNTALPRSIVVTRYDSTLHLDTSFGSGGSTTISFATNNDAYPAGMTLQRDGKIVVIGDSYTPPVELGIVRLTAGGNPDTQFGINSDGRFVSYLGSSFGAAGYGIVEDKQGRLVFAGLAKTDDSSGGEWLVDRVLSGGAADPTFNSGQPQKFRIFSSSTAYVPSACCIALQSDNKIVAAGYIDRTSPADTFYFAMARFNADGTFDPSWGIGGQSYGDMSTQASTAKSDYPNSLAIVPGGIVVGGYTTVSSGESRFVATKVQIDLLFASDFE